MYIRNFVGATWQVRDASLFPLFPAIHGDAPFGRPAMKKKAIASLPVSSQVYQDIAEMNRSFEQAIEQLGKLSELGLFHRDCLESYQVMVEEVRALANHELTEILSDTEMENSAHYERLRLKWQKRFLESGTKVSAGKSASTPVKKGSRQTQKEKGRS